MCKRFVYRLHIGVYPYVTYAQQESAKNPGICTGRSRIGDRSPLTVARLSRVGSHVQKVPRRTCPSQDELSPAAEVEWLIRGGAAKRRSYIADPCAGSVFNTLDWGLATTKSGGSCYGRARPLQCVVIEELSSNAKELELTPLCRMGILARRIWPIRILRRARMPILRA